MTQIGSQWSFCRNRIQCWLPKNRLGMLRLWAHWKESESVIASVMSNSLWPHELQPQGSSVHGIVQARILEWVAIPFSRGSSQPRDQTWVSYIVGRFFTMWATREAPTKCGRVPSNFKHWNSFMRSDSFHVFVPILCFRNLKNFNYILVL